VVCFKNLLPIEVVNRAHDRDRGNVEKYCFAYNAQTLLKWEQDASYFE
jgi:hypothetical protein